MPQVMIELKRYTNRGGHPSARLHRIGMPQALSVLEAVKNTPPRTIKVCKSICADVVNCAEQQKKERKEVVLCVLSPLPLACVLTASAKCLLHRTSSNNYSINPFEKREV